MCSSLRRRSASSASLFAPSLPLVSVRPSLLFTSSRSIFVRPSSSILRKMSDSSNGTFRFEASEDTDQLGRGGEGTDQVGGGGEEMDQLGG